MNNFFSAMINNFSDFFNKEYGRDKYPNQVEQSCQFIYDSCVAENPDMALDIGTNFGASTLSIAKALVDLNKDLSLLTTVDKVHEHWPKKTLSIQRNLLDSNNIEIDKIRIITSDFSLLNPIDFIRKELKYFIFYDIHDIIGQSFSEKFLTEWVPLIKNGFIAFHDMSLVPEGYVHNEVTPLHYHMTKAKHFSGRFFSGFGECKKVIEWCNTKEVNISTVPFTSVTYIKIKEGKFI